MPRAGLDAGRVTAAAASVADADGADALSLARVASACGVATPSLYKHVGGLDDLRRRVAVAGLDELDAALGDAALGRSGRDALVALAGAYRDFAHRRPGVYALTLRAPAGGDAAHEAAAARTIDTITRALAGYGLAGDELTHAIRLVRTTLHGFVDLERAGGFGMPLDVDETFARAVDQLDRTLAGAAS